MGSGLLSSSEGRRSARGRLWGFRRRSAYTLRVLFLGHEVHMQGVDMYLRNVAGEEHHLHTEDLGITVIVTTIFGYES